MNGAHLNMRILLIDDSQAVVEALTFWLENEGTTVDSCDDGIKGLHLIRNEKFDLIFLDIAMPEFTGLELIDSLRQEDLLKSKNIIIFTASSDKNLFEQLNDLGVKGIIKKPSSLDELKGVLEKYRPAH